VLFGLFESLAGFVAYGWVLHQGGWTPGAPLSLRDPLYGQAIGAFFAAIVTCQVVNVMVWRTTHESVFVKGLLRNRALVVGVAVELALMVVVVATPAGHTVFHTATPPLAAWLLPIPVALAMLVVAEAGKAWARRRARRAIP
jgi:sodium/potassium-transporting ATPase subunit alpha